MQNRDSTILALDVGGVRIGVAVANIVSKMPQPLATIKNDDMAVEAIARLLDEQEAIAVVLGLPRGLDGQYTAQTYAVESFGAMLEKNIHVPLYWQDEAVTSAQAEAELKARKKPYSKGDIDALAATYILEDFINDHRYDDNLGVGV